MSHIARPSARTLAIFLDESSQTKHRYLTLGALVIDVKHVGSFQSAVKYAKDLDLPEGEMKWSKVSPAKLSPYKLVSDCFFDHPIVEPPLDFHSLVVDTTKRKDHLYNNGSRDVGFSKEVYQLIMKCARIYPDANFHVYPDHRETEFKEDFLRTVLNNGIKAAGDNRDFPFRRVHFKDSKELLPIQVTDILLGAMTFRLNEHHMQPGASAAKCHLSEYILTRAGISNPKVDTKMVGKFTIWHRRLK